MADTFDLESKVNRAIYAIIVGTGVGQPNNTFACDVASQDRILPNTTITAGEGTEDDFLGNYRFFGRIVLRDEAIAQAQDQNPNEPLTLARTRASAILYQLVQTDGSAEMEVSRVQINGYARALAVDRSNGANVAMAQSAAANADMADFTIIYWRIVSYGTTKQSKEGESVFYEREIVFEALCCNSNID